MLADFLIIPVSIETAGSYIKAVEEILPQSTAKLMLSVGNFAGMSTAFLFRNKEALAVRLRIKITRNSNGGVCLHIR